MNKFKYIKYFMKYRKILKVSFIKSIKYLFLGLRQTRNPYTVNELEEYIRSSEIFNRTEFILSEELLTYHVINYYAVLRSSDHYIDKFLNNDLLSSECKLNINNKLYYCYKRS